MSRPRPLQPGDRIAIVSPSSIIKPQNVYNAMPVLREQGWEPYVGEHTFDRDGTYGGTVEARLSDLKAALLDPSTRAILCSRGGYGAVHLLEELDLLPLNSDPKWIIGFSDITALHALTTSRGIAGIHSPMTKRLADKHGEDPDMQALFAILRGEPTEYTFAADPLNRPGEVTAKLVGGNLSVIADLIATPFDVIQPGVILFIEDVAEPVYKIERIFYQLKLSGLLETLGGLVVGKFTDYTPGIDNESMEEMIARMVRDYNFPVAFRAPIGHVTNNRPMVTGAPATLIVTEDGVTLRQEP